MWSSDKKLYSSSTFKARFPAAVWEVSLRSFPVETPEDRKKESRRLYTPVIWQRTKLAPTSGFWVGFLALIQACRSSTWSDSKVSRNTAVRRVCMRERFNEWGVLSEPSCVFRNFAREIGVRSAKIDLFAHTRRLTAVLSYDKQLLLTITNTYWAVFQETNLLYFFHVPTAELEFHSIGTGLLMILGLTSQRYLSFSEKGVLQGIVSRNA